MTLRERLMNLRHWFLVDAAAHDFPEAADTRRWARVGMAFVLFAFSILLLWGFFAPLHGAVVGHGQLKVEQHRQVVQHQEGGIVKAILVKNGSVVRKGDPLLVLEDLRVDANYDITLRQYWSELAKNSRLLAERSFLTSVVFPEELLKQEAEQPEIHEVLAKERSLFTQRRQSVNLQLNLLSQQIKDSGDEIRATSTQVEADHSARKLMNEELAANRSLLDKGFISNARYISLERNLNDYQARLGEHTADLSRARQKQTDLKLRAENVRNEYQQAAAAELKESSDRLNELQQRVRPLLDMAQRQQVTAPADGIVMDLKTHTLGAAVGPREPLMDIVPADQKLLVEAKLPLDSISELHQGMTAEVRLTAYKQRTTPMIDGKLIYISADALSDKDKPAESYYLCQILLDESSLERAGISGLQPGMPADVFIQTRDRTAIQYLLDPVLDSLRYAFNEK